MERGKPRPTTKLPRETWFGDYIKSIGLSKKDGPRGAYTEPRDVRPMIREAGIDKQLSARAQKIAANLATMGEGRPKKTPSFDGVSLPDAADLLNVGEATVQRARKVLNEGTPEVIAAAPLNRMILNQKNNELVPNGHKSLRERTTRPPYPGSTSSCGGMQTGWRDAQRKHRRPATLY